MIYVTHDQVEAMTMADRIVVLRAGRVEQVGPPLELYNRPANQFVAGFIGSPRMNFLAGRVVSGGEVQVDGVGTISVPARLHPGAPVTLGIRPEHIGEGSGPNPVTGEVLGIEQLGGASTIRLAAPDLTALVAGQTALRYGEAATLSLPPDAIHVFGQDGARL
jgi:ABC-type sugar transport system ATPase subunit